MKSSGLHYSWKDWCCPFKTSYTFSLSIKNFLQILTLVILLWHCDCSGTPSKHPSLILQALLQVIHSFVKEVAIHLVACFWWYKAKRQDPRGFHWVSRVAQSDQSLHFLPSWPWMAEGNHETVMPALVRSIPSQDADERGVWQFFLDGNCPLQSSGLNGQKWSPLACPLKCWKDLDPNNLKKTPSSLFVLRPDPNIPWVTKRSGLQRAP
jgi:hypothetical protein